MADETVLGAPDPTVSGIPNLITRDNREVGREVGREGNERVGGWRRRWGECERERFCPPSVFKRQHFPIGLECVCRSIRRVVLRAMLFAFIAAEESVMARGNRQANKQTVDKLNHTSAAVQANA